ncbi:MAG: phosphoribosylanthranilate isomerase [Polyangiaceae bacterium]
MSRESRSFAAAIKICGVTNVEDAKMCVQEGAHAIGVNFVDASPRRISTAEARAISDALRGRTVVVGVVANMSLEAMKKLMGDARLDQLQLHGDEMPDVVAALSPFAYKAARIANSDDVRMADSFPGDDLLLDAKSPKGLGGTGATFDWSLATDIAKKRRITLAGGLTPENVADAIRVVSPYRVDVASGVEVAGNPRKKDVSRVRAFLAAVRHALEGAHSPKQ